MNTLWMVLRIVDLLLYGAVLSGVIMHWRNLGQLPMPGFRVGVWLVVAAGAFTTVQLMFAEFPGGPRIFGTTAGLALLTWGCYHGPVSRWWARSKTTTEGPHP